MTALNSSGKIVDGAKIEMYVVYKLIDGFPAYLSKSGEYVLGSPNADSMFFNENPCDMSGVLVMKMLMEADPFFFPQLN